MRLKALRKAFVIDLAFIIALSIINIPSATFPMKYTLAVIFVTISWWALDIMPLGVVSLVPFVAISLSGIIPPSRIMEYYLQPIMFMLIGVYLMGSATMRSGLALRIASYLMSRRWVGGDPRRIGFALMAASSIISAYVSNTACVALFLPIVQAVTASLGSVESDETELAPHHPGQARLTLSAYLVYCVLLGSQASYALMVGSPVFIAANGAYEKVVGQGMGMLEWAHVGIPMTIAVFLAFYFTINWVSGAKNYKHIDPVAIQQLGRSQGRMTKKELVAITGLFLTVTLWLLPPALSELGLDGPMTAYLNKVSYLYGVPLYTSIIYFLIPVDEQGSPLLDWNNVQHDVNWGIVLLITGAMSFSSLFADKDIGLGTYIEGALSNVATLSPIALVGLCCMACVFLTSFISSTGFMAMFASITIPLAASQGINLQTFVVMLSAMGCMDFVLPSGGAPGATAFSSGQFSITDMYRTSLPCVIAGVVAAAAVGFLMM